MADDQESAANPGGQFAGAGDGNAKAGTPRKGTSQTGQGTARPHDPEEVARRLKAGGRGPDAGPAGS